jgi:ribosomal protein S18 acetylase RimI-like enzyme
VSSRIEVRRATAADLPQVAVLAGELVRMHHERDPERFFLPERVEQGYEWWLKKELARGEAVVLVADDAGTVVGYTYASLEARDYNLLLDAHGAVHDIYVASGGRRHGVGGRLLEATLEALERLGAERIVLSVMVDNERAQRLFQSCGFRPTMFEMTRNRHRSS